MSNRTTQVTPALHAYLLEVAVPEAPVLAALRQATAGMQGAHMQIAPEQGRFLAWLVGLVQARRCLEVGTFTGYSALAMALALPADGRLVTLDLSEEWTAVGRAFWREAGVAERIDLRLGPALESLARLVAEEPAGGFDFAFLDADKTEYADYYEYCLKLVRPGGVIAVDNVLWHGSVADPEDQAADTRAIRAFNRAVFADPRVNACLVPVGDGLVLAQVR